MAIKLKPCPFCGGEGYFRTPVKERGSAFEAMFIECKKCGASPYGISVYCLDDWEKKYYAIAKYWNRRANEQDERSEIH